MIAYWKAVLGHVWSAAFDVLFVALISLAPLLLGRLSLLIKDGMQSDDYWAFMWNGQLAFFSMGSLATLLLFCFRKKLPDIATLWVGLLTCACLLFLVALVGIDPTLQQGQSFVGSAALALYLGVLAIRILADAMKTVETADALSAGTNVSKKVQKSLSERMSGRLT